VLVLSMLIIIPLLTITGSDSSGAIVTQLLHSAAHYNDLYAGEYTALWDAVLESAKVHSSVIGVEVNGKIVWQNDGLMSKLRIGQEAVQYSIGKDFPVTITFDEWENSIKSSQYSIGTTIFVIFLLTVSTPRWLPSCVLRSRNFIRFGRRVRY
jgi:hypothetical protein